MFCRAVGGELFHGTALQLIIQGRTGNAKLFGNVSFGNIQAKKSLNLTVLNGREVFKRTTECGRMNVRHKGISVVGIFVVNLSYHGFLFMSLFMCPNSLYNQLFYSFC